jgi:hypothetical protein
MMTQQAQFCLPLLPLDFREKPNGSGEEKFAGGACQRSPFEAR